MRSVYILLTFALLYVNQPAHAQWTMQNYEGYSRFNKIKFRTESEGFMIGDHSLVLKTTDGGENWNVMNIGTEVFFQDFQFIDESTLIGSGFYYEGAGDNMQSKVLKSTDNGSNWQLISTLSDVQFFSQWFFDEQIGLLAGYDGIFRTSNGGGSWDKVAEIDYGVDNQMFFINESIGFASDGKTLLKTLDQGQTWISHQNFDDAIHSMYFFDGMKAIIGSVGKTYLTTDGGNTWREDSVTNDLSVLSIDFISENTGYMVSTYTGEIPLDPNFTIYTSISRTSDGGNTWESFINPGILFSVDFTSETNGYISGGGNLILKYQGGPFNELPADYPWKIINSIDSEILSNNIFPNPATDRLYIERSNPDLHLNVELYSTDGRLITVPQFDLGSYLELDISNQSFGIYMLVVKGLNDQKTFRILKK